jgi:hypothetical protein
MRSVMQENTGCIEDEHTEKLPNSIGTLAMANNDSRSHDPWKSAQFWYRPLYIVWLFVAVQLVC